MNETSQFTLTFSGNDALIFFSVPDLFIQSTGCIASPACKYSGSGDLPVHFMSLQNVSAAHFGPK